MKSQTHVDLGKLMESAAASGVKTRAGQMEVACMVAEIINRPPEEDLLRRLGRALHDNDHWRDGMKMLHPTLGGRWEPGRRVSEAERPMKNDTIDLEDWATVGLLVGVIKSLDNAPYRTTLDGDDCGRSVAKDYLSLLMEPR